MSDYLTLRGIVFKVEAPRTKTKTLQSVRLVDDSGKMIEVTLWETLVGALDNKEGSVVELQSVKKREYQGRIGVYTTESTTIRTNLNGDPDGQKLHAWWRLNRHEIEFEDLMMDVVIPAEQEQEQTQD